ncbi:MAG: outer membrane lipoprotein-sorting protein [Treponema sp.]|nr:outer membrane lipoprotein-sorting protein [Treponema sp.]
MKRFLLSFLMIAALYTTAPLFAQQAATIVRESRNRIKVTTTQTRSRWVITAKNGSTTERLIDQFSKDDTTGLSRVVLEFKQPAGVAGTRFLSMDTGKSGSNQWIFLPSLGKVRRIAGSEGSGSFMNTDFSFDDIASADRNPDLDTHTILREENLNGKACYVIESKPKDSSYQYSKMIQWVDKSNKVIHKVELYDKKGAHVKTLEILELKDIQGRLSATKTRMTTIGGGSTTINVEILKYDEPIPESVFSTAYLETGKAR